MDPYLAISLTVNAALVIGGLWLLVSRAAVRELLADERERCAELKRDRRAMLSELTDYRAAERKRVRQRNAALDKARLANAAKAAAEAAARVNAH